MKSKKIDIKIVMLLVWCFILGLIIVEAYNYVTKPKEDFTIYQSIKTGADNYTSTYIKVIVNVKDYDVDAMYDDILEHHEKLNGLCDRLNIELFNSLNDFKDYIVASERTYIKNENANDYILSN